MLGIDKRVRFVYVCVLIVGFVAFAYLSGPYWFGISRPMAHGVRTARLNNLFRIRTALREYFYSSNSLPASASDLIPNFISERDSALFFGPSDALVSNGRLVQSGEERKANVDCCSSYIYFGSDLKHELPIMIERPGIWIVGKDPVSDRGLYVIENDWTIICWKFERISNMTTRMPSPFANAFRAYFQFPQPTNAPASKTSTGSPSDR